MTGDHLPPPPPDRVDVLRWVTAHLDGLFAGPPDASPLYRGGQTAADAALAAFDVTGYAARRNAVLPEQQRGASGLSPFIRHGLLQLPAVWEAVAGGPSRDVARFRDELLWQEYARHLYARLGSRTARPLRYTVRATDPHTRPDGMACVEYVDAALERDGWLVNQTRMWRSSQWTIREGSDWREGEDWFFRHLLDGSRAANRAGWQWTTGQATGRPYGFSRRQVERQAPKLCAGCRWSEACPIEEWPPDPELQPVDPDGRLSADPDPAGTAGPTDVVEWGTPDAIWLTAESLGDADPALGVHPELPVVFVFDKKLLVRLQLSAKRLVFLAECLADLSQRREVAPFRGDPAEVLKGLRPAVTFAPVPGFRRLLRNLEAARLYPWPWLVQPHAGSLRSFSAWRKRIDLPD